MGWDGVTRALSGPEKVGCVGLWLLMKRGRRGGEGCGIFVECGPEGGGLSSCCSLSTYFILHLQRLRFSPRPAEPCMRAQVFVMDVGDGRLPEHV